MDSKHLGPQKSSTITQSDITGYGSELHDALDRYLSGGVGEKERIQEAYGEWLSRAPFAKCICFADITLFSRSDTTKLDALSLVMAPDKYRWGQYADALYRYIEGGNTMALHTIFAMGLPHFKKLGVEGLSIPETESELLSFPISEIERVENGLLASVLGDVRKDKADEPVTVEFYVKPFPTYAEHKKLDIDKILAVDIGEHWQQWLNVFRKERHDKHLTSRRGGELNWLVAFPVGLRNLRNPQEFSLLANVFLGLDETLTKENVYEVIRYVLLHLYGANLAKLGEITAAAATSASAAHELKHLISGINKESSKETLDAIRDYFKELLLVGPSTLVIEDADIPVEWCNNDTGEATLGKAIDYALDRASTINAIVSALVGGKARNDESYGAYINNYIETVKGFTNIKLDDWRERLVASESLDNREISAPRKRLVWFGMGLVAALRNAIQHSYLQIDPRIEIRVHKFAELLIINRFTVEGPLMAIRGVDKLYGLGEREIKSLGVLQVCVKNYLGKEDKRTPALDLKNAEPIDNYSHKQTWETRMPLPKPID